MPPANVALLGIERSALESLAALASVVVAVIDEA
jgi:hypothetical protein